MQQLRVGGLETEVHEASRKVILNTNNLEAVVHGRTEDTRRQAFLSCLPGGGGGAGGVCFVHLCIALKSVQSFACLFLSLAYSSRNCRQPLALRSQ